VIPLLFLVFTGVCAPHNQSDCDYTVIIYNTPHAWGATLDKTLYFGGDFYNERDCWGLRFYEHEWLHIAYGSFHLNGPECMLRHGMFRS